MGRECARTRKHLYLPFIILMISLVTGCGTFEKIRTKVRGEAYQSLLQGRKLLAEGDYEGALRENEKVIFLSPDGPPADQALFNMGVLHAHPGNPKKDYGKSAAFLRKVMEDYPKSPVLEEAKIWIAMVQEHDQLSRMIRKLGQRVEQLTRESQNVQIFHGQKLLAQGDYEGALRENQKAFSASPPSRHLDDALFNMGLIYAHPGNHRKDYGKSIAFFQKLLEDYPQSPRVEEARLLIGMLQENDKLNRAVERSNRAVEESKKTVERLNRVIEESKKVDIQIEEKKREKLR